MPNLTEIERLEDIFEALGVAYDARVLDVHRMRLLRRFGQELQKIDRLEPEPSEKHVRSLYAAALSELHEQCRRGMREEVLVFRGPSEQLVQLHRGPSKRELEKAIESKKVMQR